MTPPPPVDDYARPFGKADTLWERPCLSDDQPVSKRVTASKQVAAFFNTLRCGVSFCPERLNSPRTMNIATPCQQRLANYLIQLRMAPRQRNMKRSANDSCHSGAKPPYHSTTSVATRAT